MSKDKDMLVDYTQKVLEVKNLRKYFYSGTGRNKLIVPAVDDVSFDVYKREVFGLVGESGCGKTTTGRTIIKLYTPTDGSTDLNGVRIGAGYRSNQAEIKRLRKEAKEKIDSFNTYKREKIAINKKLEEELRLNNIDIQSLLNKKNNDIKTANREILNYNAKVYDLDNIYRLDVEKYNYSFSLNRARIIEETHNPVQREYNAELNVAKKRYLRRVEALKESAALKKETIQERIDLQKAEYEKLISSLKEKYEPLVAEAEKKRLDKKEAAKQIKAFKVELKASLLNRKKQFDQDRAGLISPDKQASKESILNIKSETKRKLAELRANAKKLKAQAKAEIALIPKDQAKIQEKDAEKIEQIKLEAKAKILEQKDIIREIKTMNRSKESLLASRKMQMIFQDPISSLNPRMTVKEIVGEGLTILGGYTDEEITKRVGEALDLVGLNPEYGARYPHEFSGGQRQRIGIARALIMNPNFIIADEPISALDVSIRAQVINLLTKLRKELGLTMLFIAHDLSVVRFFCDRIAVMYYGKIVEIAPSEELFNFPMHPYTVSLLSAIPQPDPDYEKGRKRINYNPAVHDYRTHKPTLREIAPGHQVFANDAEFVELQKKYTELKAKTKKSSGGEKQ
jgi:oligopeptide transport system ATP-binding protein